MSECLHHEQHTVHRSLTAESCFSFATGAKMGAKGYTLLENECKNGNDRECGVRASGAHSAVRDRWLVGWQADESLVTVVLRSVHIDLRCCERKEKKADDDNSLRRAQETSVIVIMCCAS